jgi:hypothetical protein
MRQPTTTTPGRTLKTNHFLSFFLHKVKAQGVDSVGGFENAANVVRTLARTHSS